MTIVRKTSKLHCTDQYEQRDLGREFWKANPSKNPKTIYSYQIGRALHIRWTSVICRLNSAEKSG